MIRPWFLLARRRLMASFLLALTFTLLMHMWVSADSVADFGVFWHQRCGCPPVPADLRVLLNFPLTSALIGSLFGLSLTLPTMSMTPGAPTYPRFLLTRPIPRAAALLNPLAVATVALCIIPPLTTLLLLGWLRLVHAPSLDHLLAILQQMPAVRALGQHSALPDILMAIDYPARYLASVALGLCAYTIMASQRWLLLSPHRSLQVIGAFCITALWLPMLPLFNMTLGKWLLMVPGTGDFAAPSALTISLHFTFAAGVVFGCRRILRTADV